jgi:hypothetical protein
MKNAILALAALLIAAAPAAADPPEQWTGQYAGTLEPRTVIATTETAWRDIVAVAGQSTRPLPTAFDAAHKTGIGIFLGRRNTGGHSVKIVSMAPRDDKFVVTVDENMPDMNAMVAQVQTSPWMILLIDKPALPVAVEPRFHAN